MQWPSSAPKCRGFSFDTLRVGILGSKAPDHGRDIKHHKMLLPSKVTLVMFEVILVMFDARARAMIGLDES